MMDPPPPPQPPPPTAPAPPNPDSLESSPRSRTTDSFLDEPLAPSLSKLRLMCSYGGRIVPRPHDKSLCYVGGDTRIVVVDRNTDLASLSSRLSSSILNGRSFTLKYQLPNEDLDSLISVTTDEDLENMIEEYDRTSSNKSRIRLFLFPVKPDSTQSMGPIIESGVKSEDWFVSALNGGGNGLNRGFSDSATVNCLLGLDDGVELVGGNSNSWGGGGGDVAVKKQEVHSVPDSPMLETTSSFGSGSSLANLPPIRVRVEDGNRGGVVQEQKVVGLEEQFSQINVSGGGGRDEGFVVLSSPPPLPVSIGVSLGADQANRVVSDDERSDHGVPAGYRKPPTLPQSSLPQSQSQQRSSGGVPAANIDLPSPDSVSSDSSFGNAVNWPKQPVFYQEQVMQIASAGNRVAANPVDPKINLADPNNQVQIQQQVPNSGYVLQPQYDSQQHAHQQQPQQFIHTGGAHYIQHQPAGAVPMSAYIPVYPPQQQHHPQHHHQLEQQYPVYYVQVPSRQPQPYNLPVQQTAIGEGAPNIPASRPQTPPNSTIVPSSAAYTAIRNTPVSKPEMAASSMYRTAMPGGPQLVQVPSSQHQQQYVGYSQVYYTQPMAPTIPSQYQTTTAASSVALPEASPQLPTDNVMQQIRTSQPI